MNQQQQHRGEDDRPNCDWDKHNAESAQLATVLTLGVLSLGLLIGTVLSVIGRGWLW